jgi:hypothetical protein
LRPVYLGDALFSCQPLAEAVLAIGADFLFVCKKDGHKTLYEFVDGAPLDEHTVTERKPGKHSLTYRYGWIEGVPLRDGKDALAVNWLAVTITDSQGKTTYDGAFVTSLPLTTDNLVELAACARARWKIENERLVAAFLFNGGVTRWVSRRRQRFPSTVPSWRPFPSRLQAAASTFAGIMKPAPRPTLNWHFSLSLWPPPGSIRPGWRVARRPTAAATHRVSGMSWALGFCRSSPVTIATHMPALSIQTAPNQPCQEAVAASVCTQGLDHTRPERPRLERR